MTEKEIQEIRFGYFIAELGEKSDILEIIGISEDSIAVSSVLRGGEESWSYSIVPISCLRNKKYTLIKEDLRDA